MHIVTERSAQNSGANSTYQRNTQQTSMSTCARIETSHHGGAVAEIHAGVRSVMGGTSWISTRAAYTRGFGSADGSNCRGLRSGVERGAWSVKATQWVLLHLSIHQRTPRPTRLQCAGAPSHRYRIRAVTASGYQQRWQLTQEMFSVRRGRAGPQEGSRWLSIAAARIS
jgi:hypothetical protein